MPPPGFEPFLRAICETPKTTPCGSSMPTGWTRTATPSAAEFIRFQIEHVRGADWATRSKGVIPQGVAQLGGCTATRRYENFRKFEP